MESSSLKWLLGACFVIGICVYSFVRYLGEKNAQRHPIEVQRQLVVSAANESKNFSPWWEFVFGCFFIIFALISYVGLQISSEKEWLLIGFVVLGLRSIWCSIKELKSEKT